MGTKQIIKLGQAEDLPPKMLRDKLDHIVHDWNYEENGWCCENHIFQPNIYPFNREEYKVWSSLMPQGSFGFFDSSIWNILLLWDKSDEKESQKEFERICKLIKGYKNRYNLIICREYKEFACRKYRYSWIANVADDTDNEDRGHADAIRPFVFHSEGALCKGLTIEGFNNELFFLRKNIENYKWNILLVDDHALDGLEIIEGNNSVKSKFGKAQFIEEDIKYAFPQLSISHSSDISEKQNIFFTCVDSVAAALSKLKEGYRYDLILLDYKMGEKQKYKYGTHLLSEIDKDMKGGYRPCPAGKYNFLFVSGYPDAVHDSMNAEGMYSDTDKWFVRRGACPINTPYLFLYELLRLMEHRVKPLMEHVTMVQNNSKTQEDAEMLKSPSAISFIKWLYSSDGERPIRNRCKNAFNAFLTLRSIYDKIKYDVFDENRKTKDGFVDSKEKESRLIFNMFPDVNCYSNTFWEHMQHLVYLTAYGTNRQWPEMWEELLSVCEILKKAENRSPKYNTDSLCPITTHSIASHDTEDSTVKRIRKYILNLKSENSR